MRKSRRFQGSRAVRACTFMLLLTTFLAVSPGNLLARIPPPAPAPVDVDGDADQDYYLRPEVSRGLDRGTAPTSDRGQIILASSGEDPLVVPCSRAVTRQEWGSRSGPDSVARGQSWPGRVVMMILVAAGHLISR
jgi:hypothetical protein